MATVYSNTPGDPYVGVPADNVRRVFNFGDRIAELKPLESPFFVYLSKTSKIPTDDHTFKFLERRHQWQRRNFACETAVAPATLAATIDVDFGCKYDKFGRVTDVYNVPGFLLVGQTVQFKVQLDTGPASAYENYIATGRISAINSDSATARNVTVTLRALNSDLAFLTTYAAKNIKVLVDADGRVTGSAFAEASGAPDGWTDALYNREGYAQIFKTAIPLFSGSTLATRFRGVANEFNRVWAEKLMEHKMDLENTALFGVGRVEDENGSDPKRFSWGVLPYTELYGNVYDFSYSTSTYDTFIDTMKDFNAPELGNSRDKLVLTSRNILGWLQKLGDSGFLKNSVTAESYKLDVQNIMGTFGHEVTRVRTVFGNLHFVEEPLFRDLYADYAMAIDMKNVAWRPLSANGVNRDTHVITNVQNNDIDGRKDLILTEAGLEIDLPETHAIFKFA